MKHLEVKIDIIPVIGVYPVNPISHLGDDGIGSGDSPQLVFFIVVIGYANGAHLDFLMGNLRI
jgi:hypothetical protein